MIIAIAQINPTIGDFDANKAKILQFLQRASEGRANIVVFPELAISGYTPQDLVLRGSFCAESERVLYEIVKESKNFSTAIVIGGIINEKGQIFNSAFFIFNGKILHRHDKLFLPNYSVFDEKRLFSKGELVEYVEFLGKKIVLLICEDIWCENHIVSDIDYIIVINASPYEEKKAIRRINLLKQKAQKYSTEIIYVNMIGAQDSVIYDGGSLIVSKEGQVVHQSIFFQEVLDFSDSQAELKTYDNMWFIYNAILLAIKDYARKNSVTDVVIGLSGGIDSTVVTMLAIDALGKDRVHLVTLPSKYSSTSTYKDTESFLHNIGKANQEISIEAFCEAIIDSTGFAKDITLQNLQSRIRGLVLMAISNEHDYMLLSTGNKSELAIGYATLYGDMNGGFNPLKDLYKRDVYNLAKWRNKIAGFSIIPESIINKAPTAELKADQKDSDDLPEYEILDEILYQYIECGKSRFEIINSGFDAEIVDKILKRVRMSQFKRNQATLGPKIRNMSFDLDWRYPVTNKFWK